MDDIDRAQAREEWHRAAALQRQVGQPRPSTQVGLTCLSCGEEIEPARRAAVPGACLCLECQEQAEGAMR